MPKLKVGNIVKVRNNYYKVAVGTNKPSCERCWFFSTLKWCCLDGTAKNHLANKQHCKELIDINEGQYFTIVPASTKEGL